MNETWTVKTASLLWEGTWEPHLEGWRLVLENQFTRLTALLRVKPGTPVGDWVGKQVSGKLTLSDPPVKSWARRWELTLGDPPPEPAGQLTDIPANWEGLPCSRS